MLAPPMSSKGPPRLLNIELKNNCVVDSLPSTNLFQRKTNVLRIHNENKKIVDRLLDIGPSISFEFQQNNSKKYQ